MRRNRLNGGFLVTTSLIGIALGSARPAHAGCTPDPLTPTSHVCTGISAAPGAFSFSGTDISVLVAAPSVFFNSGGATDQISISGDGALAFTSEGSVLLLSDGAAGVNLVNTGVGTAGSIAITTAPADPSGPDPWRIEGATAGIQALNRADGDITITLHSLVVGGDAGVIAQHDGAGSIGLMASGGITASQGDGLGLTSGTSGTGIAVGLNLATVIGANHGIHVRNAGPGEVTLSTMETSIEGQGGDGIRISDLGEGSIEITTEESDFEGIAAQGAANGIRAENGGAGSVRITIGKGDILGGTGDAISVLNDTGSAEIVLRLSGPAIARGGASGIDTRNLGTGGTTIDAGEATDRIDGQTADGLRAYNGKAASTGISITTGFGDGTQAVIGKGSGIAATNAGGREIWLQTGFGAITGQTIDGIGATNGPLGTDITIGTGVGTVSGLRTGIDGSNAGTGNLTLTTLGEVLGTGGTGIRAANGTIAAGGEAGDDRVQGGDLALSTHALVHGQAGDGIEAANTGLGQLLITTNAEVRGDRGTGILARSGTTHDGTVHGTGLAVETYGFVFGSLRGIDAANHGTGALTITAWEDVTGGQSDGIRARSGPLDFAPAGAGALTIATFGQILGEGGAGIRTHASSSSGASTLISIAEGSGVRGLDAAILAEVAGGQAIRIDTAGDLQNLLGADTSLVVRTSGGRTDLTNHGSMTGRIAFGAFDDVLTNHGTWSLGGTSDFHAGNDALTNTGTLIAANRAGLAEMTVLAGLERLASDGLIDLSDETAGGGSFSFDRLEIAGSYDGAGGTLRLDAFLGGAAGMADRLVIGGPVAGRTAIVINNASDGPGGLSSGLLLVDTNGSTGTEFVLADGPISFGGQAYDLFWDGEDFLLQSTLDLLRLDPVALPAILGGLWDIGAAGWHRNTRIQQAAMADGSGVTAAGKGMGGLSGNVARGWATVVLDERSGDGSIHAASGTPSGIRFDQTTRALIGGVDLTLPPDANGGTFTVGALLGTIDSSVNFDLSGDRATFDGPTFGLHLAYSGDRIRADLIVIRNDLDLEYFHAGAAAAPARADTRSTGASLEFGVMVHRTDRLSVEAVGNLSQVETRIDSFATGISGYGFGVADTTRGAVGLTVRSAHALGATKVTPSATVKYWTVFDGAHASAIDAVVFGHDAAGNHVEASAMLEFENPVSGWNGFVSGSGFAGGSLNGAQAQVGLSVTW